MLKINNGNRNAIILMALFFTVSSVSAQDILTQNPGKIFELESSEKSVDKSSDKKVKEEVILDLKQGQTTEEEILFKQEENKEEPLVNTQTFSFAVQAKDYEKIESFLKSGANINQVVMDGNTLVSYSALFKDVMLLELSAKYKANLSNLNSNKESIIYLSAAGNNVEYLQKVKSLMNTKDFDALLVKTSKLGRSALHNAVLYKADPKVVEFLVENKVPMEIKDNNGQTVLHYAAVLKKWDALEILLKHGGNIKEVDKNGQSVESYIMDKLDIWAMPTFYKYLNDSNKRIIESRMGGLGTSFSEQLKQEDKKKSTNNQQILPLPGKPGG